MKQVAILMLLLLPGCTFPAAQPGNGVGTRNLVASASPSPRYWDEARLWYISWLRVPPKGIVGKPLPLLVDYNTYPASSLREVILTEDEASRTVTLALWLTDHRSDPSAPTHGIVYSHQMEVIFTPKATGTYSVRTIDLDSGPGPAQAIEVLSEGAMDVDWWVPEVAFVRRLEAPATATVGVPAIVTAWVDLGPEHCTRLESATAAITTDGKWAWILAMKQVKKSPLPLGCGVDQGPYPATLSVIPIRAGVLELKAPNNTGRPQGPEATASIRVSEPA